MATMNVKNSSGGDETVEKPLAPGRAAATASRPVVLSNEDAAFLDGIEGALALLGTQTTSAAILAKLTSDPATQTTLAAVLAKIIAAPATEAKQDTGNTSLGTIAGKDFATQTTLAAVLAKIIAAPATEAKQDTGNTSLSTIAGKDFSTQTTLAAVLAKIIAAPATEAKQDTTIGAIGSLTATRQDDPDAASASLIDLTRGEFSKLIAVYSELVTLASLVTTSNTKLDTLNTSITSATDPATNKQENVAASQTDQVIGATGAVGDTLQRLIIVPASLNPGAVSYKDGSGTGTNVFAGGSGSVATLHSFQIEIGVKSLAGAWKVTTGANVSVIAIGAFT